MIKALFKKEFIDAIRDKRSVFAALIGALVTPLFFAGMMTFALENSSSVDDLYIDIVNQEQAPHIISLFEQAKIKHADKPQQGKNFVLDGEDKEHSEITLTFADDFAEKLSQGQTAEITLLTDYSREVASSQIRRVKEVIKAYESQVGAMKLITRGISPNIMQVIKLNENDTSSPSSKSAMILGLLGVMILGTVFISPTNVAIDSSAGERERNSLELLLMQPVNTFDVVVAKMLNTVSFGVIGLTLAIVLSALVVPFVPLHKLGGAFNFDLTFAVSMWLIILPLAFFAAAIQLTVAFHAKSFKEAQSYIQYTIMVPFFIPFIIQMTNYKHPLLEYLPVVAQQQAISQLFRGELESYMPLMFGSALTLVCSAILVMFISKSLKSEKVVLGL